MAKTTNPMDTARRAGVALGKAERNTVPRTKTGTYTVSQAIHAMPTPVQPKPSQRRRNTNAAENERATAASRNATLIDTFVIETFGELMLGLMRSNV
jgi:hypothetical protein